MIVERQRVTLIRFQLIAGLVDHLDDLIRREVFALLQLQRAGFAVYLAAADVDVLGVGRFIPLVVLCVVAKQIDLTEILVDLEVTLARVSLTQLRAGDEIGRASCRERV